MKLIDINFLKKNQNRNIPIINVLSNEQFDKEHIPESINIPLEPMEDFAERAEKLIPNKSQQIIVYCFNTLCSASKHAAEELEQAGYQSVMVYEGGIQEWKESGEKVESKAVR